MENQPASARAVVYTRKGAAEAIDIQDVQVRTPRDGEVRIRVTAAAVNPTDILLRDPATNYATLPVTPGMDAAGVVEAVGPGVTRLKVGDAVMAAVKPGRPEGGAQAGLIVAPEASAVAIPAGASLAQASTLPMNGLTALQALALAGLEAGQTIAITGGAGLLAHYATAAAKHQGLTVVADAKPAETDLVRGYGADIVVERSDNFAAAVRAELPGGVDALLDTALLGRDAFGALRDGGIYLPVRGWNDPAERGIAVKPVFVSEALERTDWLELLRELAESGRIKLNVAGEYPIERTFEAQERLAAGGLRGRPVLVFEDASRVPT
jgi:NADPH2:quinone reductase